MNLINKSILLLTLIVGIVFTSCKKDPIDIVTPEEPTFEPGEITVNNLIYALQENSTTSVNLDCITLQFPFELKNESDQTLTISSYEELETAVQAQKPNRVTDFVFPINAVDENGNPLQVIDNVQLGKAFASCVPSSGWDVAFRTGTKVPAFILDDRTCYSLVYPINLEDDAGNNYVANNELEFYNFRAIVNSLYFSLPMTFEDADKNQITVNDANEFMDAILDCDGFTKISYMGTFCFEIQYPYDVLVNSTDIVTISNDNEYVNLVLTGADFQIVFPVNATDSLGSSIVINDIIGVIDLLLACGLDLVDIDDPRDSCSTPAHALLVFNAGTGLTGCGYLLKFPFQMTVGTTTYDINNQGDYFEVYNANPLDDINLVYPVPVTLADGSTLNFQNDKEICDYINNCTSSSNNSCGMPAHVAIYMNVGTSQSGGCGYVINYPYQAKVGATVYDINNLSEYQTLSNNNGLNQIFLEYPMSVTLDNGNIETFNNDDEICDFIDDNC